MTKGRKELLAFVLSLPISAFLFWVYSATTYSQGLPFPGPGTVHSTAAPSCTPASGYSHCRVITLDHTKVGASDATNFSVLICGNSVSTACSTNTDFWKTIGNGGSLQSASCFDLIYTSDSAGTTTIPFEAVPVVTGQNCDVVTGKGEMWVLVATLSHTTDTLIYTSYGNAAVITDQSNRTGTWNTNYKAVYHLHNGTTIALTDSTSGAHTLTNANTTATSGQIDGAAAFNGTSSRLSLAAALFDFTSAGATVECWLFATADNTTNVWSAVTGSSNRDGMETQSATGTLRAGHFNGTTTTGFNGNISLNTWYHAVYTLSSGGTTAHLYINGVDQVGTNTGSNNSNAGFALGARTGTAANFFPGTIDEVRVSNVVYGVDYALAAYNNQNAPSTFFTIGSEM